MKYLFVTVKKVTKKPPTEFMYKLYLNRVKQELEEENICKIVTETDSKGRIHLHLILHVEDDYDWNRLKVFKTGWHVHTLLIPSHEALQKVDEYLDKEEGFNDWLDRLHQGEYLFQASARPPSANLRAGLR